MTHFDSRPTDEPTIERTRADASAGDAERPSEGLCTSRRSILGALGAGAVAATGGLAGVVGSASAHGDEDHVYVRCPLPEIRLEDLPVPVREEVAAALADGVYTSEERPRIVEVMDLKETYVLDRGTYYRATVERLDDGSYELALEEDDTPTTDSPTPIRVENDDDVSRAFSILVEDGDDVLFEEIVELDPGEGEYVWEYDVIGSYDFTVETDDGQRIERTLGVSSWGSSSEVWIDADGDLVVDQAATMPPSPCSFEAGFEDHRYEPCERLEITYDEFPADVQAELDAALENDGAATFEDPPLLLQTMSVHDSYVRVEGTTYVATVIERGTAYELALEEPEIVTVQRPRDLQVENNADEAQTLEIRLADDDEVLFEEAVTLEAGESRSVHRVFVVGTYDLRVETESGEVETFDWGVSQSGFDALVAVTPDGGAWASQAVADLALCEFDTGPNIELNGYEPNPHGEGDLYRDVDGTGSLGSNDVVVFFEHVEDDAVQDHPEYFDFNGSGSVGFDDVVALFEQV